MGDPGCGKSKAAIACIALTGSYPKFHITKFTDKGTKKMSTYTSQGLHLDDADSPKEVALATKRYFDGGIDAQDTACITPQCGAVFTFNFFVMEWLQKKVNAR